MSKNYDICIFSDHKLESPSLEYLSSLDLEYKCIGKDDSLLDNYRAYHGKRRVAICFKETLKFSVYDF